MKSGYDFYKKDAAYRMMKKELIKELGKEKIEQIWKKAGQNLNQLWMQYDDVPALQRRHTHNEIFPRIAMYRALQEKVPERAMSIMDNGVKIAGVKVGKMIGTITSLPGMSKVFIRIMRYGLKNMFGESASFKQLIHHESKEELKFDILVCPYCKFCNLCGCPELIHNFCDSDVFCYGNLPGVYFSRTQTLGTGGTCCDFHFKVERKK